jgi:hypothetical protein
MTVTVEAVMALTLPTTDVSAPAAGPAEMQRRLVTRLEKAGIPARVSEIGSVTLARNNPHAHEETFRPDQLRILNAQGGQMPDRQVNVRRHERVSHPFELLMQSDRDAEYRSYGYFASSFDAMAVGRLWQRGFIDVLMKDLPLAMGEWTGETVGTA